MKVWRVAHETARYLDFPSGPYFRVGLSEEINTAMDDMCWSHSDADHPDPNHDANLKDIRTEERCGFSSEDSLNDWFAGFIDLLAAYGFKVWVYEVPEVKVRVGKYGQALFDQNFAVLEDSHEFKKELVG